ncbi:MAG: hypothetical protein KAJ19_25345, partial [Gammaproteobacteria bacterium]|nr:hypothetical protein [Gammaproteobacteria bacterium]
FMLVEEGAELEVYWYIDVTVKDSQDNLIEGGTVILRPKQNWLMNYISNLQMPGTWLNRTTPANGRLQWNEYREAWIRNVGTEIQAIITVNASVTAYYTGLHSATEKFVPDMSRHITLTLGPNAAPPAPTNATPAETHNTTPLITWDPAIDPDGDAVKYCVNIWDGPAGAGSPLVDDVMVTNHSYQVLSPLEYGHTYTVEVISKDSYGMYSDMVQGQVDVVNTAPAITAIDGKAVPDDGSAITIAGVVNTPVSIVVEAVDDDTDPTDILTFTDDAYFFDIDPANGTIEWTPSSPQWGNYTVNITVSDGIGGTDTVTVLFTITTPNLPPVADAGDDYVTTFGGTETLNGTGSYDPDGDISRWVWKCVSHSLAMEDADGPNPTFDVAYEGVYVFTLRVQDDNRTWCEAPDTVTVTANKKGYVNEEPDLIGGTVTPEYGDVSEDFIFYVNYVDADGDLPGGDGYIRVVVDDVPYNLTALEPEVNVSIRTVYGVTLSGEVLGVGSDHTYRFEAHDGLDPATGDTAPHFGPVVIDDPFVGPNGTPPDGGDGG